MSTPRHWYTYYDKPKPKFSIDQPKPNVTSGPHPSPTSVFPSPPSSTYCPPMTEADPLYITTEHLPIISFSTVFFLPDYELSSVLDNYINLHPPISLSPQFLLGSTVLTCNPKYIYSEGLFLL